MSHLGSYLTGIAAAGIMVAVCRQFLTGKGADARIGQLMCGIFLLFTILRPLIRGDIFSWQKVTFDLQQDASQAVAAGDHAAKNELKNIIRQQTSAYILARAAQYHAELSVEVILSEDEIPIPVQVRINGSISPYGKRQLQAYIAEELGVAKEDQIWS